MAKKKILQDSGGQIWPVTVADCVYLTDGSKTVKKYIDDGLASKAGTSHGNHVPTTQTADNTKFLRNDNTWQSVTPANIGALSRQYKTATTAATAGWYRIATSVAGIERNMAMFEIDATVSGRHSETILAAGICYGQAPTLNQLAHTEYSATGISKARIVYHTTYSGNYAYLEVYVPTATATTLNVKMIEGFGWSLTAPNTAGSVPSGYTNKEITFTKNKIVADFKGTGEFSSLTMSGSITLDNNNVIRSKTAAGYTNTNTSAAVASGSTINLLQYNNSGNLHLGSGMYDNYLSTGSTYINSSNNILFRTRNTGYHQFQINDTAIVNIKSDIVESSKNIYAKAGVKSGGNIVSDTALTDDLGTSTVPWNLMYAKGLGLRSNSTGTTVGCIEVETVGTTSTVGASRIVLGNSTASGTNTNAKGYIKMYGTSSGYTDIVVGNNTTSNITLTLPSGGGTLARTSDNITGSSASCTGNAATATQFSENKSVTLTGDVTGTASSKAGWSVATTLANSGVTAGSYGPSAAASPAHGGTFSVPYITVDAKGRVTSASTKTITLPADNNTDTKVTNTLATTTKAYVTGTTSASTNTGTQVFDTDVYLDTTAGKLVAKTFAGNGESLTSLNASNISSGTLAAARLATSGVTASSYGPSANASPAHSGTFSVPYITVDKYGRITAASTKTITLPSDNNTDTKVTNTLGTTTKFYLTGTTSSSTNTGTQYFDTGIYSTTTAGQLQVTNSIITPKITFPSNSNDTDDYCYITSNKSSTKTSMDFYVGNDIADGTATSTTEDKFVFHLPDMGDYQIQTSEMKFYNEIFIGAYGVLELSDIRAYSLTAAGCIYVSGTSASMIKNMNPGTSTTSTLFTVGDSSYRYYDVYCTRGAFNGSDSKLKKNIKTISRNGIMNDEIQTLSATEGDENVSSMVTSYDLYNYVKDAGIYSYKYKTATLDLEDDEEQTTTDSEYYIGVLADEIPDDIFNVIGTYSKTEEEYLTELDKQPELLERYNTLVENGYYDEDKNLNKLDRISGMTLSELKEKALSEPEEPVRLINAPAQVAMLQEVLSIALSKIEILEARINELEENN